MVSRKSHLLLFLFVFAKSYASKNKSTLTKKYQKLLRELPVAPLILLVTTTILSGGGIIL